MNNKPNADDVEDSLIPAPIYLPKVEREARNLFRRGMIRDAFFEFYRRAQTGSADAQAVIAFMYLLGYVKCEDKTETANYWARQAALANNPFGIWVLAWILLEKGDFPAGLQKLMESANLGFSPAFYHLGSFSNKGILVPRDFGRAKALFEIASSKRHVTSQRIVRSLYKSGKCGTKKAIFAYLTAPFFVFNNAVRFLTFDQVTEVDLIYYRSFAFETEYGRKVLGRDVTNELAERVEKFMREWR